MEDSVHRRVERLPERRFLIGRGNATKSAVFLHRIPPLLGLRERTTIGVFLDVVVVVMGLFVIDVDVAVDTLRAEGPVRPATLIRGELLQGHVKGVQQPGRGPEWEHRATGKGPNSWEALMKGTV